MYEFVRPVRRAGREIGLGLICLTLANAGAASAQEAPQDPLAQAGIAPITELFDRVESGYGGRILMVELAGSATGPASYEVKLLTDDGNVLKLRYDARTLSLEDVDGRDAIGSVFAGADDDAFESDDEFEDEHDDNDEEQEDDRSRDRDRDDDDEDGGQDRDEEFEEGDDDSGRGRDGDSDDDHDDDDDRGGNSGPGGGGGGNSGPGGGDDD